MTATEARPALAVEIAGMKLKNPVMSASGCFGWGEEYARFLDLTRMGARWLEQRLLRRLATHLTSAGYLGRGELTALLHLVAI